MKKITLLKSLLIVLAMSFFSVVAFAQATTVGVYKKVTAAPADGDWSGQYLIVGNQSGTLYIQDGSTYNGSGGVGKVATWIKNLCVFSADNSTIEVTQAAMDRALQDITTNMAGYESYYANGNFHFTIDKEGRLILATGSSIGAGTSNGKVVMDKTLANTATQFFHTISLRTDGSAKLASINSSKTYYLWLHKTAGFKYYTSTSASTTYFPIYLYKLETAEGGEEGGEDATTVAAPTASVESGDYLEAFNLTLACATEGATIKYKVNGGAEQTYSEAINISATTTLVAWSEKDTLKSEEVTFTYNLPAEVANIAAFVADESGKNVRIASTMTVVFCYSSYLYVKDESGYMLVKGQVNKKNPAYKVGDQFTGLVGQAATANGVKQLTPANFPTATATGVAVEPEVVAAADVTLAIPHKYIKLEGAKLESKSQIMLTASLSGITFNITDLALKYMNDKTIVVGDYIDLSAIVSADSKGVNLTLVSMEKAAAPIVPEAPAPAAVQYGGGYFTSEALQVELTTTETRPNNILVTLDGSEPTYEGVAAGTTNPVTSGQKLPLTKSTVVKVRTILFTAEGTPYQTAEGAYLYSDVVAAKFTKLETPATPVFTPAAGDYYDSVEVSIACATANTMIKYAFGGTEPTGLSAMYAAPFKLKDVTTVSAVAYLIDAEGNPYMDVEGLPIASAAAFATYNVTPYVAPAAPAVPTIQYGGGYFTNDMLPVAVTTTETRPNYILVTIDGSEPSFEGVQAGTTLPVPSGQQIQLTESKVVKVRGMLMTETGAPYQTPAGAYIYSDVATAKFTKVAAPAAPVFTPAAGDYYDSVLVSIACATENVLVKYEFGGTEPTGRSATYTEPFKLTATTTVSAMAFLTDAEGAPIMDVEGMPIASLAAFAEYKVTPYVAPEAPAVPTIQYGGGYFTSDMLQVVVNTTETRPTYILVTIDGSEPSFEGVQTGATLPAAPGQPIQLTATTTVKVRGLLVDVATGAPYQTPAGAYIYSDVATAIFTKVEAPAAPEFTPAAGEYYDSVEVSIACATENVMIKYEFGGTEPTGRSATYTEPFKLTENTVVSAIAFLTDAEGAPIMDVEELPIASAAVFAEYVIKETIVAPEAPVFSPEAGEFLDSVAVTLACETESVVILYDLLGLTPNFTSPRFEEEPIIIKETTTIAAIAVLVDEEGEPILNDEEMPYMSEVVTATYVVTPSEVGVDNIELVAIVYAKGGMVYVDTEIGNTIEVFTVQGQRIFAAEATSEMTAIDAFNAEVLLVKVNNQIIKVAIK